MEISNVAVSSQQASGGVNALSQTEQKDAEAMKSNGNKEAPTVTKNTADGLKEDYTAVSKDGDTLTLSDNIKSEGIQHQEIKSGDGKVSAAKMTDAALSKCSGPKLRQLLQQGKISKQQYEKAIKKAAKKALNVTVGDTKYEAKVELPEELRNDIEAIKNLIVTNEKNESVPLSQLATISFKDNPLWWIYFIKLS